MKWILGTARIGEERQYRLFLDDDVVASARWFPVCADSVEVHNTFSHSSKNILVKSREMFGTIRSDIVAAGYEKIVAVFPLDTQTHKALKYLKFMGFEFVCGLMEA